MKMVVSVLLVLSVALFFVSCGDSIAPTGSSGSTGIVVMQFLDGVYPSNGYTGTEDTMVYSAHPYDNSGTAAGGYIGYSGGGMGKSRMFIKFDVSNIVPSDAHVVSAYLKVNLAGAKNNTINACAITSRWDETGCSWISRTASDLWTTPGGDYGVAMGAKYMSATECEIFLNEDIVEGWISSPSTNYGMVLAASDETTDSTEYNTVYTSDNASFGVRPSLTVYYTP
ncbi:MAG: DNRLRE domain-containing protein [Spirochaetia bacterium]|nr:DNRLRE domain-containing protein [Spirochaetia bacterium]